MIFHTIMELGINTIKNLFFNDSLKHWHFEELLKSSKISRERVNFFIKKLLKDKFILKIKDIKKMPYYISNVKNLDFRFEKKMYGLKLIKESGLFEYISTSKNIKTAILFGSFSRGDFGKSSDIDLFIYGDSKDFDKARFELNLKREIQLFIYNNKIKMKKELDQNLIPNLVNGFNIKNEEYPFNVSINV